MILLTALKQVVLNFCFTEFIIFKIAISPLINCNKAKLNLDVYLKGAKMLMKVKLDE